MKRRRTCLIACLAALCGQGAIAMDLVTPVQVVAPSDVADAAMQRDAARLQTLLKAHADVNAPQPDGSTALHWAAYQGDAHAAAALLAAGAHPNAVTDTGMTPLVMACEAGNLDLVKALVRAGANVNQTLSGGETPLMMAARTGSVPVVKLLLAHGAGVDVREKLRGTTALMWAAANGNSEAVRFLISKGADVSAHSGTTDPGRRPYLAQTGRERISEFAGGYGAAGLVVKQDSAQAQQAAAQQLVSQADHRRKIGAGGAPAGKTAAGREEEMGWPDTADLRHPARETWRLSKSCWPPGRMSTRPASLAGPRCSTRRRTSTTGWANTCCNMGAKPNIANGGGWNPLYIATDNRNIEAGDYPVRKPDMDHLDFIKELLAAGAGSQRADALEHGDAHGVHQPVGSWRTVRRHSCAPRSPATWC